MEKTGPEGVAVGSRRLYWYRTGGCTGGREGGAVVDSGTRGGDDVGKGEVGAVVDSGTRGGDDVGEAGGEELRGGDDTGETGGEETETDSSEGGSGNRKDRETDGAGVVVEEGEA